MIRCLFQQNKIKSNICLCRCPAAVLVREVSCLTIFTKMSIAVAQAIL